MAVPAWFDYQTYRANKLADLTSHGYQYDAMSLGAAFQAAGFTLDEEGMYKHFEMYGNSENISPNALFDANYYYQAKAAAFFDLNENEVTSAQVEFIKDAFTKAGLSAWDHYTLYGMKEGIDPNANFSTNDYLNAKLAKLQAEDPDAAWDRDSMVDAFKSVGLNPVSHYFSYGKDEGLTYVPASHAGVRQDLTVNEDNLVGTMGDAVVNADGDIVINQNYDDYFNAEVVGSDHQNTLQSEDIVNGLAGSDTLYARVNVEDLAGSLEPTVVDVETVLFRSQIGDGDNPAIQAPVSAVVDADRISLDNSKILTIGSDNSRADLTIEDLRHYSNKTIVRFADADPEINYSVFFDPQHLKSDAADSSGTLTLTLIDLKNASEGHPLEEQPYNGLAFTYSGSDTEIELLFRDEDVKLYKGPDANYDKLLIAFQHALEDFEEKNPDLAGKFSIVKGEEYTATRNLDGIPYTGNGYYIVIQSDDGTVGVDTDCWILSTGRMPSSISIEAEAVVGSSTTCPLIKVDVELDNVGRVQWDDASPNCLPNDVIFGSNAGDLEIGSMAMRGGIERMDVKVDEGSWLQGLYSTNDTLRMITVEAKDIDGDGEKGGQLYIGTWEGDLDDEGNEPDNLTWTDPAQLLHANGENVTPTGLKDVAVFDATGYEGQINVAANITEDSYDKYFKSVDGEKYITKMYAPLASDKYSGDFTYITGKAGDIVNMTVNGDIAADVDFGLNINTADGDDLVAFRYDDMSPDQSHNQKYLRNVNINTESGDDTVWFYDNDKDNTTWNTSGGSVVVNAGAGLDTVYVNQQDFWGLTGGADVNPNDGTLLGPGSYNAVFVYNAADRDIGVDGFNGATLNNDIDTGRSSFELNSALYTSTAAKSLYVTVDFLGLSAEQEISGFAVTSKNDGGVTTYTAKVGTGTSVSAEVINHAIIDAIAKTDINGHSLSELIAAKDGAGHSLIIESLINGQISNINDLSIGFEVRDSRGGVLLSNKSDIFTNMTDAAGNDWYSTQYAYKDRVDNVYDGSTGVSDSQAVVNGSTGNDLIVLGNNNLRDVVVLDADFGKDIIVDFEHGIDKINVSGLGFNNIHERAVGNLNSKAVAFIESSTSGTAISKLATDGTISFEDGVDQGAKALVVVHSGENYAMVLATKSTVATATDDVNARVSILGSLTFDDTTGGLTYDDLSVGSALVNHPELA